MSPKIVVKLSILAVLLIFSQTAYALEKQDTEFNDAEVGGERKTQEQRPNLLFILTDQQRFDALSIAGNKILKTRHMDRIGREGVMFRNAYTSAPVCGPARTSLLTGLSIENTGVRFNDGEGKPGIRSYDQVLVQNEGYIAEYFGKWHAPKRLANVYRNKLDLDTFNLFGPLRRYLARRGYTGQLQPGQLMDTMSGEGYVPAVVDSRLNATDPRELACECDQWGVARLPRRDTLTAFEGRRTIAALKRLNRSNKPWSLHVSFNSPHGPHTPSEPWASLYDPSKMPVPASINDQMGDSPYFFLRRPRYSNPATVGNMIALYYAQMKELDGWIGRILRTMDRLGITNNTMVVLTADHGEMLGSHGMIEKDVFYEESVHVPLLIRFPNAMPRQLRVSDPVSHRDLFATILDYMGAKPQPSDGNSLRAYIERTRRPTFTVAENGQFDQVMIRAGRSKLILPNTRDSKGLNTFYDLRRDPHETNNLIFWNNTARAATLPKANLLKRLLLQWCVQTNSPHTEEIRNRRL